MRRFCALKITLLFPLVLLRGQVTPAVQQGTFVPLPRDTNSSSLPYPFRSGQSGNLYLHNPICLQTLYNRQLNRFTIRQRSASSGISPEVIMSGEAYRK